MLVLERKKTGIVSGKSGSGGKTTGNQENVKKNVGGSLQKDGKESAYFTGAAHPGPGEAW